MPRRLRATSLLLVVVAFGIATLAQPALADASVGYDLILSGHSRPIHVTSAHDPDVLYIVQQGGTRLSPASGTLRVAVGARHD
jgi:hypothetical protein